MKRGRLGLVGCQDDPALHASRAGSTMPGKLPTGAVHCSTDIAPSFDILAAGPGRGTGFARDSVAPDPSVHLFRELHVRSLCVLPSSQPDPFSQRLLDSGLQQLLSRARFPFCAAPDWPPTQPRCGCRDDRSSSSCVTRFRGGGGATFPALSVACLFTYVLPMFVRKGWVAPSVRTTATPEGRDTTEMKPK